MSLPKHQKNYEIEALRAIAVFLPVLGHLGNLLFWYPQIGNWSYGLWAGVDIFFCISGYVITNAFCKTFYSAARLKDKSRFVQEVFSFYIRRAYRIFPSAMLWLFVVTVLSVTFNSTGIFGSLTANLFDWLSVATFLSNFHFVNCYTDATAWNICGTNGIYWSVSLEEQFYFIFPFLFFLRMKWIGYLSAITLIGTCIAYFNYSSLIHVLYTRTDGILLGVALAIFKNSSTYELINPRFFELFKFKYLTAFLLIGLILVIPSFGSIRPLFFTIVTILCTVTVWVASYNSGYLIPTGIVRNILSYIGARSFAIYLIHNPVFLFTRELWARIEIEGYQFSSHDNIRFLLTSIVLIAILSEINFRFVETPLRKLGIRKSEAYLAAKSNSRDPASCQ